jgi:hypothetical protein
VVLCAYAIGNAAGPFMWKKQYQPRWDHVKSCQVHHTLIASSSNHVPWAIITACFVASVILLLVLRFMLASENRRRDAEQRDDKYDEVFVTQVRDGTTVEKKVDRVRLCIHWHSSR